jgi:hypothetical protein
MSLVAKKHQVVYDLYLKNLYLCKKGRKRSAILGLEISIIPIRQLADWAKENPKLLSLNWHLIP